MDTATSTRPRPAAEIALRVTGLTVAVPGHEQSPLVDGVDFELASGETLGLVGESGSGKSLTCTACLDLLPAALAVSGSVQLAGEEVRTMSRRRLREVRGATAAMIFQEPMSSLNPVLTVGTQLSEALRGQTYRSRASRRARAIELLDLVGINEPKRRLRQYAGELSGGMCQRVMIAIALAGHPKVLIADEPTTALDVTIQAQVLQLLKDLTAELEMALLLVTHDLGVVAETCDRVAVMYAGQIVEHGPVSAILETPTHPYTEGLLRSLPSVEGPWRRLPSLPGSVPAVANMPSGCRYHPRCPIALDRCGVESPPPTATGRDTSVACWARGVQA